MKNDSWDHLAIEQMKEARLKPKPKAPKGYIDFLNKKVKVASYECRAYMDSMMKLEAERHAWVARLSEALFNITDPDLSDKVTAKLQELESDCFWVIGKGAKMTPAEEHFAYIGEESPETPKWKE